jgi:hypothetical protein
MTQGGRSALTFARASLWDLPLLGTALPLKYRPNLNGVALAESRVFFETNVDNYGEIWIDGRIDRPAGVINGINASQRVEVSAKAVPGTKHVIACLVANGPLAEPRGGVFMRYATLAFESRD